MIESTSKVDVNYVVFSPWVLSVNNMDEDRMHDALSAAFQISEALKAKPEKHYLVFTHEPGEDMMYFLSRLMESGKLEIVSQEDKIEFLRGVRYKV